MSKKAIHSDRIPQAIGPYSPALSAGGLLFISGQLGIDPKTGIMAESLEKQTRLALAHLDAILEAAGSGPDQVLKTTVLLTDMADFATVNEIYGAFFSSPYPARACFAVKELPGGGRVEIECIAKVD